MHIKNCGVNSKRGQRRACVTKYLVCEWDSEIQNLAVQLPFSLVLHVGDLNFNRHGTLSWNTFMLEK